MKNLLVALILFLTVSSCLPEKKSDVEPDLAGTYQISQLVIGPDRYNFPFQGASANAVISRKSDTEIEVIVNVIENGTTDPTDYGTFAIRKTSGKDYDVLNPTTSTRLGSINGTDFTLDFTSNGQRYALISRK
ncbi:hypothetical protein [Spirosoma fluviale]|uniref:Lipocalin-like domain-containing protein n=1 Tax=Spirosoma fluviale TaxID=1597977 RepID=A0A286G1A7_9BACT|nr:hypothetical protein [Spirosoma fluviale]SOD89330.1 hypothetical protein SAMN06269250_3029 [Spirosoma fluviale]